MIDYGLYLVTDDPSRYAGDWLDNVLAAVEGGVTCVQYRDTESDDDTRYRRAKRLHAALKAKAVPLVINNDVQLAAAIGSEGVHVGQGDMPADAVRAIIGNSCEIGLSLTCLGDARRLLGSPLAEVVDCVGIGPVYDARKTKADAARAMGPAGLAAIVGELGEFSNCAIGGINLENAAEVLSAGARGLAVVSAFSKSEDPYETARDFTMLLNRSRL